MRDGGGKGMKKRFLLAGKLACVLILLFGCQPTDIQGDGDIEGDGDGVQRQVSQNDKGQNDGVQNAAGEQVADQGDDDTIRDGEHQEEGGAAHVTEAHPSADSAEGDADDRPSAKREPDGAETANGESQAHYWQDPDHILVLVNKDYALPEDYEPKDLVKPDVPFIFEEDVPKRYLRKEAARALEQLFAAAEEKQLHLFAVSGYRSYERQEAIFASNAAQHGEEEANQFSARAGESEHQTGLVMDVTSPDVNYDLVIEFGETKEGKWLQQFASEYGFIIRYPQGKEHITGYQYEPWHLRYVGRTAAKEIMVNDLTLEEYLGEASQHSGMNEDGHRDGGD